jgi:hypothetical protein
MRAVLARIAVQPQSSVISETVISGRKSELITDLLITDYFHVRAHPLGMPRSSATPHPVVLSPLAIALIESITSAKRRSASALAPAVMAWRQVRNRPTC